MIDGTLENPLMELRELLLLHAISFKKGVGLLDDIIKLIFQLQTLSHRIGICLIE